jgi:CheY-like chemotaxis protein
MAARRALVVDDSPTAREFLTVILERYELAVDSVESAEQAIEYLIRRQPDVIFMDHQMPGMDGLQAVQVIKNNPRTATIPIMMYTSQAGELYLSQARALGAVGVLPKQIKHADVSKALDQLKLLGEPKPDRQIESIETQELSTDGESPLSATRRERRAPNRPDLPALPPDLRAIIEALLVSHGRQMRRAVVDDLESVADRIVGAVRLHMQEQLPRAGALSPRALRPDWRTWLGLAGIGVALLFGLMWKQQRNELTGLAAELTHANEQLSATQQSLSTVRAASNVPAGAPAPGDAASGNPEDSEANEELEPVPFGEMPLTGARLERIAALLSSLSAQGFRGVVEVRSVPGRFCMIINSSGIAELPSDATPYSKCDQVGIPPGDNGLVSQSEAFANMVSNARHNAAGKIDVQISAGSPDEVAAAYPPMSESLTAGEWNHAAAQNNRVELHWQSYR